VNDFAPVIVCVDKAAGANSAPPTASVAISVVPTALLAIFAADTALFANIAVSTALAFNVFVAISSKSKPSTGSASSVRVEPLTL